MATRGRKPAATAVATKRGTLKRNKKRRDDSKALPVNGKMPERPDFLDEFAEEKWAEMIPHLSELGILSSDMVEMLTSYCEAYAGWRRCRQIIKDEGEVVIKRQTMFGPQYGRNPASTALFAYRAQMDKLLPEFGLTPSSKTRLKVAEDKEEDPFMALASRIAGDN